MRKGSYSDTLRFFTKALQLADRVKDDVSLREYGRDAIRNIIKALLMLRGFSIPDMDLTFMGSVALDSGIIDKATFSRIVRLNLGFGGFGSLTLDDFRELMDELIRRASSLDPYLSKQMELYRY
ncbi:MAG: hypothetical protein J7L55_04590 [Desulfurococcales archaeon]|nr:hypothetical protein [Desulfurococcales archaeon]